MEKMKTYMPGNARLSVVCQHGDVFARIDGNATDLACCCALAIEQIAAGMKVPPSVVLLKVVDFLAAKKCAASSETVDVSTKAVQDAANKAKGDGGRKDE